MVKEEPGFHYGYAQASTKEEADAIARKELVEKALTAMVKVSNPAAKRVTVSAAVVEARLGKEKPWTVSKDEETVAYRMKEKDWDQKEKEYAAQLRTSLSPSYTTFNSKASTADRLSAAAKILNVLAENGETDLLTLQEGGTELYARKVEAACLKLVQDLEISFSVSDRIINPTDAIVVTVKDSAGKAVPGLKLKASWIAADVPVVTDAMEIDESISYVITDALGNANVDYPIADEFKNRMTELTVSTAFANTTYVSSGMRKLDGASAVDSRYYCLENIGEAYQFAEVAGGVFMAGKLEHDKKASHREEAHEVELADFEIAVAPVTNVQYMAYSYLTRASSYPEYLDNENFNNPMQPIIYVSYEDANAYAEWLSDQLGATFRLPTEEEWEKAARGGAEVIYPWGDDDPKKDKCANFKGNGKFKYTSPVGSFENGNNALGLVDMSGNVWEWTTSQKNEKEESVLRTVKGGSYMDGPADLRISNYKNINPDTRALDVGIRLVKDKEISK